jgi:hypothetical protein
VTRPPAVRVSRRAFLAGSAGMALLAACGGGDGDDGGTATTTLPATEPAIGVSLIKFFGDDFLVPGIPQRATFGVGDAEGVVSDDVPDSLEFTILSEGAAIGAPMTVPSHREGVPRPYFPVRFTAPQAGFYTVKTVIDGQPVEASFGVVDRAGLSLPQIGEPLPAVETPTVTDGRGVDPICTADTQCPLHEVSLTQALTEGRPVALLVSTPKFCQVAICGPVLDVLLDQQAAFPEVRMIHAEVYTDETIETLAPVIEAMGLTYEPALFVTGRDGVLAARLDNIYDSVELAATLQSVG